MIVSARIVCSLSLCGSRVILPFAIYSRAARRSHTQFILVQAKSNIVVRSLFMRARRPMFRCIAYGRFLVEL